MKRVIVNVDGMTCSACSNTVEKYLSKQDGIVDASVNLVMGSASITYDDKISLDDIAKYINASGYKYAGLYNPNELINKRKNDKNHLIIFSILIFITMYVSMGSMIHLPMIPIINMMIHPIMYGITLLILSTIFLIYASDILKVGIKSLINKSPNMDSLVSIGVISSYIYSFINLILLINGNKDMVENLYFESVATVIYFVKLGRYIDHINEDKTKDAIKGMVTITPEDALIKIKNGEKKITIDEVKKGDILICKPGMKIAVDGKVVSGKSHIDEAFITGESKPVKVTMNSKVVAGAMNIDGVIEYRADAIGAKSTISEIIHLVINATNTASPITNLTDKISYYFCPVIIIISIITLIIYLIYGNPLNVAITHFVSVLVIACPCALGLATPLAMVVSLGKSAQNGILVRSSSSLEIAKDIDTVIFDKTGTLTEGKLNIEKLINYSDLDDNKVLSIIASLESNSSHPIARVFDNYKKLNVSDFKNIEGHGLRGKINDKLYYICNNIYLNKLNIKNDKISDQDNLNKIGATTFYLICDKKIIAMVGLRDKIRASSKSVISKLINNNIDVVMLTGDNRVVAYEIASELGIKNVISDNEPVDKINYIKELKSKGKKVMMVGDGINDAPSLSEADIGVSLSSSTDIAINSANVLLMNDNLNKIILLINISKNTIKNIKENLIFAFLYNILMIPVAIGLMPFKINPWMASIAMMLSSFTVIINALRLKKMKLEE